MANRQIKILIETIANNRGSESAKKAIRDVEKEAEASNRRSIQAEEKAANEVRRINDQTRRNAERTDRLIEQSSKRLADVRTREARKSADNFIKTLREMETAENRFNSRSSSRSAFAGGFAGGLVGSAIAGTTTALTSGAAALFDYQNKVESLNLSFTTLVGSSSKAQKFLSDLKDFARSTPFQYLDLAPIAQRLLGANVQLEKVIPLMRDLGNVTAATGQISSERLEGIGVALSQIISKGKVSAEEMEQLAERGIPAWNILAQAIGKSVAETRKLSEDGRIGADTIVYALQKISRERYGDAMAKQSQVASTSFSKIVDAVTQAASTAFQPLYKKVSEIASRMNKEIQAQKGDLNKIGEVIAKYIGEGIGFALTSVIEYAGSRIVQTVLDMLTQKWVRTFYAGIKKAAGEQSRRLTDYLGLTPPQSSMPKLNEGSRPINYDQPPTNTAPPPLLPDDKDDKRRQKEREQLAKAELSAQIELYQKQIQEIEEAYKKSFSTLEEYIKNSGDPAQFQATFNNLKAWYGEQINELVPQWEELVRKQTLAEKKGTYERRLAYEEAQKKKEQLAQATNDFEARANKLLLDSQKDSLEKRFKAASELQDRDIAKNKATLETQQQQIELAVKSGLITEEEYYKKKQEIRVKGLEYEQKWLNTMLETVKLTTEQEIAVRQELFLIEQKIKQARLEGAVEVIEFNKKQADKEKEQSEKRLDEAEKLAKKQKDDLEENQKRQREVFEDIQGFFENKLQTLANDGFKGLFKSILDDLKNFLIKAAAQIAASKLLKFLTGQDFGTGQGGFNLGGLFGGNGSNGSGLNLGSIFGGSNGNGIFNFVQGGKSGGFLGRLLGLGPLFGGGAMNAAGSGLGSFATGAGSAGLHEAIHTGVGAATSGGGGLFGGLLGGGGLLGSLFGGGSAAAGGTGAAGAAAGGGGFLSGLAPLLTNPWTIGIAGAALGAFGLYKLFNRNSAEKRLKKAAQSEFGIDVKDKSVLKSLKAVGESQFGKIKNDEIAKQTVRSEAGQEILDDYQNASGQKSDKLSKRHLGDENYSGNYTRSTFSGFNASGGIGATMSPISAPSITASSPSSAINAQVVTLLRDILTVTQANAQSNDEIATNTSRLSTASPHDIVTIGAETATSAIYNANNKEIYNGGARQAERTNKGLGYY